MLGRLLRNPLELVLPTTIAPDKQEERARQYGKRRARDFEVGDDVFYMNMSNVGTPFIHGRITQKNDYTYTVVNDHGDIENRHVDHLLRTLPQLSDGLGISDDPQIAIGENTGEEDGALGETQGIAVPESDATPMTPTTPREREFIYNAEFAHMPDDMYEDEVSGTDQERADSPDAPEPVVMPRDVNHSEHETDVLLTTDHEHANPRDAPETVITSNEVNPVSQEAPKHDPTPNLTEFSLTSSSISPHSSSNDVHQSENAEAHNMTTTSRITDHHTRYMSGSESSGLHESPVVQSPGGASATQHPTKLSFLEFIEYTTELVPK